VLTLLSAYLQYEAAEVLGLGHGEQDRVVRALGRAVEDGELAAGVLGRGHQHVEHVLPEQVVRTGGRDEYPTRRQELHRERVDLPVPAHPGILVLLRLDERGRVEVYEAELPALRVEFGQGRECVVRGELALVRDSVQDRVVRCDGRGRGRRVNREHAFSPAQRRVDGKRTRI